jgi:hypothetical protein
MTQNWHNSKSSLKNRWEEFLLPINGEPQGLYVEMGPHQHFCPGQPQTTILPISDSRVAGITGVSHHAQIITIFPKK